LNRFAKNDSPRRKRTVSIDSDSGWLYTDDDIDEWEDSLTDIRLAKLRQGPRRSYDDDEDEEDWPDEDDWDDDSDFDEYDDEDYDWDDDEEEDSDEW